MPDLSDSGTPVAGSRPNGAWGSTTFPDNRDRKDNLSRAVAADSPVGAGTPAGRDIPEAVGFGDSAGSVAVRLPPPRWLTGGVSGLVRRRHRVELTPAVEGTPEISGHRFGPLYMSLEAQRHSLRAVTIQEFAVAGGVAAGLGQQCAAPCRAVLLANFDRREQCPIATVAYDIGGDVSAGADFAGRGRNFHGADGEVPSNFAPGSAILSTWLNAMCWAGRWNRAVLTH